MSMLRNNSVNSSLLGMTKFIGYDSARRALSRMSEDSEDKGTAWLQSHLSCCYQPLLSTSWILDVDVTVKPVYGHQEGAVKGYTLHKQGRPSQAYHSYLIVNLRLVLDVEVQPGNQTSSKHSLPRLFSLLGQFPEEGELETISRRSLLLSSIGRPTKSGMQKLPKLRHCHAYYQGVESAFQKVMVFFKQLKSTTQQLTKIHEASRLLYLIFLLHSDFCKAKSA